MKLVTNNNAWIPQILEGIFTENRLDVPNYENFSIPSVNIQEKNTNFVIELAVPGLKKEHVAVEIDGDILTVSSSMEEKEKESENSVVFTRKEFNFANFKRIFSLPETVQVDAVTAS